MLMTDTDTQQGDTQLMVFIIAAVFIVVMIAGSNGESTNTKKRKK